MGIDHWILIVSISLYAICYAYVCEYVVCLIIYNTNEVVSGLNETVLGTKLCNVML
jgi:hypothetical protein